MAEHEHVRVAVIGSGFGGLGAAVRLRREGITDFVVLERADSVGGTWRDNSYPGCACDVPSHLYSFSFAPNPDWPRTFSGQRHIRAYLEHVTDLFGLRPHIRFGSEVTLMTWDGDHLRWTIETSRGTLTADVVVSATGPLSDPKIPEIPGLESFPGKVFPLRPLGPRLRPARQAGRHGRHRRLRDPDRARHPAAGRPADPPPAHPAVGDAPRRPGDQRRRAVAAPAAARRPGPARAAVGHPGAPGAGVHQAPGRTRSGRTARQAEHGPCHQGPRPCVPSSPPDYRIGCKRILLSSEYYPALAKPNVDVVAAGLSEIRGSTVVAADGTEAEVDAIIFGTGFHVTDMPIAERVVGAGGSTLAESWKDGMQALRGGSAAGFPNFLTIIGPNTGLGNSSMILMIESQLNYLADYLRQLDVLGGHTALDARPSAVAAWNRKVQERMKRTVWNTGGCTSWYLDASGRNTTVWPGTTTEFRRATRRVDLAEYEVIRKPAPVPGREPAVDSGRTPAAGSGQRPAAGSGQQREAAA